MSHKSRTLCFTRCEIWIVLAWFATSGCSRPAALDTSEGRKAAEALYTAVTSKKVDLLDRCDERLKTLQSDAKLSERAYQELMAISSNARDGRWQTAAEKLDWFIRHQAAHSH